MNFIKRKDHFPARQTNKPDTEQDLIPHEESVEAMMENLFNTTYQARTNKLNDSAKKYITLLKDDDYSKNGISKFYIDLINSLHSETSRRKK